jgi:hypothetical protein
MGCSVRIRTSLRRASLFSSLGSGRAGIIERLPMLYSRRLRAPCRLVILGQLSVLFDA